MKFLTALYFTTLLFLFLSLSLSIIAPLFLIRSIEDTILAMLSLIHVVLGVAVRFLLLPLYLLDFLGVNVGVNPDVATLNVLVFFDTFFEAFFKFAIDSYAEFVYRFEYETFNIIGISEQSVLVKYTSNEVRMCESWGGLMDIFFRRSCFQ